MNNEKLAENRNSITFRIHDMVLDKLKNIAKNERISLNTLANQVFTNYVEWDATAIKAGWIIFHKTALRQIFDSLDDESLIKLAVTTADYVKDVTLLMSERNDLEGYLFMLRNRAKRSGFVLIESHHGADARFILQHDMGRNWSAFFKAHYERMLHNLGHSVSFDLTDNTLVMDLKNRK